MAISTIKPGDHVLATDTRTGKTRDRAVTAVHVNYDRDLLDVQVKGAKGRAGVVHATASHPFWSATRRAWVQAGQLHSGDKLSTTSGTTAHVGGGNSGAGTLTVTRTVLPRQRSGVMWDLTVEVDHDFYITTSDTADSAAVLVHNCGEKAAAETAPNLLPARDVRFTQDSIGSTFKDGRSVMDTADEWAAAGKAPEEMEPIRIFTKDGNVHSLDNRRLFAGQYANVSLPYRWATSSEIAARNQTQIYGGTSISVRFPGGNGNWGWWRP